MLNTSELIASTTAINNTGTLTIEGGTYRGSSYSLYSNTTKTVSIKDATLNGTYYNASSLAATITTSTLNGSLQQIVEH